MPPSALRWRAESRIVLVLQRLEREKDTDDRARAPGRLSGLAEEGWRLRVVGDGAERAAPRGDRAARGPRGCRCSPAGRIDVPDELADAAMLLAPAPAEPFGLAVVEAMAAGVPVVAAAGGGHLETVGRVAGARTFPPGDAAAAATALRALCSDELRAELSAASRLLAAEAFTVERQVDGLAEVYTSAMTPGRRADAAVEAAR